MKGLRQIQREKGICLGHVSADCDITINSLSNIVRDNHSPAIET